MKPGLYIYHHVENNVLNAPESHNVIKCRVSQFHRHAGQNSTFGFVVALVREEPIQKVICSTTLVWVNRKTQIEAFSNWPFPFHILDSQYAPIFQVLKDKLVECFGGGVKSEEKFLSRSKIATRNMMPLAKVERCQKNNDAQNQANFPTILTHLNVNGFKVMDWVMIMNSSAFIVFSYKCSLTLWNHEKFQQPLLKRRKWQKSVLYTKQHWKLKVPIFSCKPVDFSTNATVVTFSHSILFYAFRQNCENFPIFTLSIFLWARRENCFQLSEPFRFRHFFQLFCRFEWHQEI